MKQKKEGDKITKVCVEDVYKIINRVYEAMDKAYNNSTEILDSVHKTYESTDGEYEGELIIGTGVSQPCKDDVFNEEVGNEIAFKKAKLNANIKKAKLLYRIYKEYFKVIHCIDNELDKIENLIQKDISDIREYNSEYLLYKDIYGNT